MMGYRDYVMAAYFFFAAVLLWDYVAPRIRTRQLLRATRLLAARKAAAASPNTASANGSLPTGAPDTSGELQR